MPIGELVVSIIGDMSKLSGVFTSAANEVGTFGSKMSSVGSTMSSAGSAMTSGISVPLAAVSAGIGATLNSASDFDTGMRRVATMLPEITESGFKDISNQALTLSKDFGSSTSDMTNAMYQALSSGVPQENIFTFMQDAEKLAIGGATDVVTSTDVLTNAVNSYGAANLSTAKASDILFQGTKFGKSTVEELAQSLSNVVPIAASVGIGFDDVNASLATMTIQGTPTAEATTQLRAMIDALSTPTDAAAQAFDYLSGQSFPEYIQSGHTVGDAIQLLNENVGKQIPVSAKLNKVIKELQDPTSELAKQFQALTGETYEQFQSEDKELIPVLDKMGVTYGKNTTRVSDYFGRIEAGTGALQLLAQNGEIYKSSMEGMGQATGSTDQAFKTMSEGSGAALDRLKSSFEVLTIKIGDAFLPILADTLVPAFSSLISVIDIAIPAITFIANAFNALPGPIKLGALAFTAFVAALGPVLMIAGSIASGIGAIAALFGAGGVLAGAGTVISGLVAGLSSLAIPIVAVIAALVLLYTAWKNNWGNIQGVTARVVAEISNNWNKFRAEIGRLPGVVSSSLTTLKGIFSNSFNAIITIIQTWINNQATKLSAYLTRISTFKTQLIAKWTEIKNGVLTRLNAIASDTQSWITNQAAKLTAYLARISTFKTQLIAKWTEIKTSVLNKLNAIISDAQNWISNQASKLTNYLSIITTFKNNLISKWTEIKTSVLNKLNEMTTGIKNKASDIANAVQSIIDGIKNKVSDFKSAGQSLIQGLIDGIESKIQGIKNSMSKVTNAANNFLTHSPAKEGPFKKLPTFDPVLYDPLMATIKKTESNVLPQLSKVLTNLNSPLSSALSNIKNPLDSSSVSQNNSRYTSNTYKGGSTTTNNNYVTTNHNNVIVKTNASPSNVTSAIKRATGC